MSYLTDVQFSEQMPARAKRLYKRVFDKYHKLNGGDEEVALHLARQALERHYVKLNERWYPKAAAELIVRHDMDDDGDDDELRDASGQTTRALKRESVDALDSAPIKQRKTMAATRRGADITLRDSEDDDEEFAEEPDSDGELHNGFDTASSSDEDDSAISMRRFNDY